MSDNFLRQESQERRANNREYSTQLLRDAKIAFEIKNEGAHLIVEGRIDFWPGTGKWIPRDDRIARRGVKHLMHYIRAHPQEPPSFSPNFDERNGIK